MAPGGSTLVLLGGLCAVVGVWSASNGTPRWPRIGASIAAGQLGAHWILSLGGVTGMHAGHAAPDTSAAMLAAHSVAVLVCSILVVTAERLYGAASSVVTVAITAPVAPAITDEPRPPVAPSTPIRLQHNRVHLSRRGPPALSFT